MTEKYRRRHSLKDCVGAKLENHNNNDKTDNNNTLPNKRLRTKDIPLEYFQSSEIQFQLKLK